MSQVQQTQLENSFISFPITVSNRVKCPLSSPWQHLRQIPQLFGHFMEKLWKRLTPGQNKHQSVSWFFISSVTSKFEQHLSFLLSLVLSYISSLNGNFGCPKVVVNFRPSMKFKLLGKGKFLNFIAPQSSFPAQAEMTLTRAHASPLSQLSALS